MNAFNAEYDKEILRIIAENPKAYGKMLKSRGCLNRHKNRQYLQQYIMDSTPLLNDGDFEYSFKTRIFWTVNNISSWTDGRVCCKACGEPIRRWNVTKLVDGYKATCCDECERKVASQTNKETCMARYGVTNVFASQNVMATLAGRRDEIQQKREDTKIKHFGNRVYNNPAKAKATKIKRYGSVWHLEKCQESMVKKYGAPNPMQVSSIQRHQQQAIYVIDKIKFDSSWEVCMYIWLRDNSIPFQYHPEMPEFWYTKDDGSRHRYYPDFILTESGEIWEPKGDNSFDERGYPIKNGWFDWHEKYEYMKKLGVRFFFKSNIKEFEDYVANKYGAGFVDSLRDSVEDSQIGFCNG